MPSVQFNGITLIRQNIGIRCESSNTDFIQARGEVNELEGFFCVMKYVKGADIRAMPKYVKISVSAYGTSPNEAKSVIYSNLVSEFEVQLVSEIKVETKFRKGVNLYKNSRKESIKVFSSSDFKVQFDYETPEEGSLILHQVTQVGQNSNEYNLTIQVPNQVSHAFSANMILSHNFAKKPTIV